MRSPPVERRFRASGAEIAYFEWDGAADAPLAIFLHATGFHARVWDETIRALPETWRAIAVELRGHGRSEETGPISAWEDFAPDIMELFDALDVRGAIGVGHSLGGFQTAWIAAERPETYAGFVLCDPVIASPEIAKQRRFNGVASPADLPVARRKADWADWRSFHAAFKDRSPYSLWRPKVFEDYCRFGLRKNADGAGRRLACAPLLEASVYFNSWRADVLGKLHLVRIPVTILRAKFTPFVKGPRTDYLRSTTWEGLAGYFADGEDVYLPERTHFIPMEDPDIVADAATRLAERINPSAADREPAEEKASL